MIDADTSLFAVLGHPVSHSLSPLMHNQAFADTGFNGVYLAFDVQDIRSAVSAMRALGMRGASITIPHKVSIIPFLDKLDETAEEIGAVNTVINRRGVLTGYNSDGLGAVKALADKTPIKQKHVAIIGAGGSARAIGFGIRSQGGNVTILNRSADKGEQLARELGSDFQPLSNFKNVKCQILINATPVGMTPHADAIPVRREDLEKQMIVMDIVYNPLRTRLLKAAIDAGCEIVDGVSMFVHQGAFQFELWTGRKAPFETMRQVVLEALRKKPGHDRD